MANPFVHVELHTNDPAKAKAFYSKLFGWKLEDVPMPGGSAYTMAVETGNRSAPAPQSLTGRDNYFENFAVGDVYEHARGKTVGEIDNVLTGSAANLDYLAGFPCKACL